MTKSFSSSILLSLVVAMLFVAECSAIKCSSCFSAANPDCMDNPSKYEIDCSDIGANPTGRNTSCQKILQKLEGDNGYRVTRQCSDVSRYECIERVGTRGVRAWYCHCNDKNSCNGSNQLSVAFSSLLLVAIALVLTIFDR